jgi:hypothetical protein
MKKVSLSIIFLLVSTFLFAQGEANIWYFGVKAGIDFNSGSAVALTDGGMVTAEGCSVISNASGQLIMYTNGESVWNKNHVIMSNGTGLLGHNSSTQSSVIIPKPGVSNLFYIFTTSEYEYGRTITARYSVVDTNLNGGLGDVTTVKNVLLHSPSCEKLTAVKKANGSDYWIITHLQNSNSFYVYELTSAGVSGPIISNVGPVLNTYGLLSGYMKLSPDGKKLANASVPGVTLFDFDNTTGMISNPVSLFNGQSYGVEFSSSNRFLYVSQDVPNTNVLGLVQYDLSASNISLSNTVIYQAAMGEFIGALQIAPDGKIYMSRFAASYLSVVNNPEGLGAACNFNYNGLFLDTGSAVFGLPQFIQSYFSASIDAQNLCVGNTTSFSLTGNQNILSATWDFGDSTTFGSGQVCRQIIPTQQLVLTMFRLQ